MSDIEEDPGDKGIGVSLPYTNVMQFANSVYAAHKPITISRPRNESKEDKKARKSASKAEKQTRRMEKRATKEQFDVELKNQKRVLANRGQRIQKL